MQLTVKEAIAILSKEHPDAPLVMRDPAWATYTGTCDIGVVPVEKIALDLNGRVEIS